MKTSVALCTFNGEKHIKKQLESILLQSVAVDEIIVCDDGSTDETVKIIENFQQQYLRKITLYINQQQLRIVKNFEKAISLCSGDIIFLSDQDDCWSTTKVETILTFFETNKNKNVVFTNAFLIDEKGESYQNKTIFDAVNFNTTAQKLFHEGFGFELININNRITGATMAFRKGYILKLFPFPKFDDIVHDEIIAINAINDTCLGFIPDCLIEYRIHSNQQKGLEFYFNNIPSIDVFKYTQIKNEYFQFLKFNTTLSTKINFINYRGKNLKSIIGILYLLLSFLKYYKIYSNYTFKVLLSDIKYFLQLNLRRIKRINK